MVTDRVRKLLEGRFTGFDFGPVEMIQRKSLKRPKRVTKRTKKRVWLPYDGPPVWDFIVTARTDMDLEASEVSLQSECATCGRMIYTTPVWDDLVFLREPLQGASVFMTEGYGPVFFAEEIVRVIVEAGLTNFAWERGGTLVPAEELPAVIAERKRRRQEAHQSPRVFTFAQTYDWQFASVVTERENIWLEGSEFVAEPRSALLVRWGRGGAVGDFTCPWSEGDVLVTDRARAFLEERFSGFSFRAVEVDDCDEPDDVRPRVWQLVPTYSTRVGEPTADPPWGETTFDRSLVRGADIFRADELDAVLFTEEVRVAIEDSGLTNFGRKLIGRFA
jgi:hypothetical protein